MVMKELIQWYKKNIPAISSTEQEASQAGTIGFEQQLFNGTPDWKTLFEQPKAAFLTFSIEEQLFFDTELNALCRLLDDWKITHDEMNLSEEAWSCIRNNGFLGLIIPKQYGGKAFSVSAVAFILMRLSGKSVTAATTVGVANSLGPAELLLHYGTDAQKDYYLPRLASGEEIPCFALTGPNAGSDAASIPDRGIVCRKEWQGHQTVGILLNWNKRYITLCPIATVMGLAFHLFDPEHLLGDKTDVGLTCALIPSTTSGIVKGRRHFPVGTALFNGPTQGKDVFIPLDWIIGGVSMAGHGWRMLMESLSAGRAITLPAGAAGGAQMAAFTSGAYARVRQQFNRPIAEFEGIKASLAKIGGYTYIINAALSVTLATLDRGAKPAILSAILKCYTTDLQRKIMTEAMDIHGGKTICLGPKNYLARAFEAASIGITVEGANILTRHFIIYGQGALRCHPFIQEEMLAAENDDVKRFRHAIWGHGKLILRHFGKLLGGGRASVGATGSRPWWFYANLSQLAKRATAGRPYKDHLQLDDVCKREKILISYFKKMRYYSIRLAFLSDIMMLTLGAKLKRKERISARLADMLSELYLLATVLKYYRDTGEDPEVLPLFQWSCQTLLVGIEGALWDIWQNVPQTVFMRCLKRLFFPWGRRCTKPLDILEHEIADLITRDTKARTQLCQTVFQEPLENNPLGRLNVAFKKILATESIERKVMNAAKEGKLDDVGEGFTWQERLEAAFAKGIITREETDALLDAEKLRQEVIAVDDFDSI